MNKRVKVNFLFQVVYQLVIIVVPFLTAPYVSRVLGAELIGTQTYYYTLANYFVIFAMLGLNTYGNRKIAMVRDNEYEKNKTFSEILILHFIISIIVCLLSFILLFFINPSEKIIFLINLITVVGAIFDINWLYFGLEKIKNIVIKNVIVKLISLIIIFAFVKTKDDLWIYSLSISASSFIGIVLLWGRITKYVKFIKVNFNGVIRHLKPLLVLFLPVIAINLYKYMDKLMIDWLSTRIELGYYENSEKIINIPNSILNALSLVMLPYCSNLAANNKIEDLVLMLKKTISIMIFISIPIMFGIAAIMSDFIPLYYGNEFEPCVNIIILLSLTILPMTIANIIRAQYLMPLEYDKEFIISLFSGALINMILNILFIPKYGAMGAAIGTVAAEYTVALIQVILIRKKISLIHSLLKNIPYIVVGFGMFCLVYFFPFQFESPILNIFIKIIVGSTTYIIVSCLILYCFDFKLFYDILCYLKLKNIAEKIACKKRKDNK